MEISDNRGVFLIIFTIIILFTLIISGLSSIPVSHYTNIHDAPSFNYTTNSSETRTPIKHVIIIIEENHAFDNLFGLYPFGYSPIINNITRSVMEPQGFYTNISEVRSVDNTSGKISWILVPNVPWFPIAGSSNPYYADASSTVDPYEGWKAYHGDYWFDTGSGFVYYSGPQSMAYFSYQQSWILWDYAEEYSLYDNYYAPIMGFTEPNRIAYLIGEPPGFLSDSAKCVTPFSKSIMYKLSQHNISWNYYVYHLNGEPWPLDAFIGASAYSSHYLNFTNLYSNLSNGTLPSVSYVMMLGGSTSIYDMHPPYNITAGSIELSDVINHVEESIEWNSTAIFVTMDEGGGYYDGIIPPSINQYGLGQRIPLIAISPFSREAYVDNYTVSGYSLLSLIDYNWNLPYLTPEVSDGDVNGLLASFNFSMERSPIILSPSNWEYPMKLQYPVHYGYMARVYSHKGYSSVYSSGYITILLPLDIISFSALLLSFRYKKIFIPASLLMIVTLSLAAYLNSYYMVYQFVTEYYLYSSIIGMLVVGVLFLKKYGKKLNSNQGRANS